MHEEDDANVALFHPHSGAGVVYGTKQGQIACALCPEILEKDGLWPDGSRALPSSGAATD